MIKDNTVMKRIANVLVAALLMMSGAAAAQTPASQLKRDEVASECSGGRYAALLERFTAGQQLSPAETATVYYGSAFQDGFDAGRQYPGVLAAFSGKNYAEALRLCEEALANDPTNLTLLFKAYAAASGAGTAEAQAKATKFQTRLLSICDAIMESGTGVTDASPLVVVRPGDIDEFVVKYMQPLSVTGHAKLGSLDAVKVKFDRIPDEVILYFAQF